MRFPGHAAHLPDSGDVKVYRELLGVGKQKVGAQGQVEHSIAEAEVRQFVRAVAAFFQPLRKIVEEALHGCHSEFAYPLRRSDLVPYIAILIGFGTSQMVL